MPLSCVEPRGLVFMPHSLSAASLLPLHLRLFVEVYVSVSMCLCVNVSMCLLVCVRGSVSVCVYAYVSSKVHVLPSAALKRQRGLADV